MNAAKFQANKVKRLIRTQGQDFVFKRPDVNEFGEPTGQTVSVEIKGVYHETTSYVSKSATEATTIRSKFSPMILCMWTDGSKVSIQDILEYNGKSYLVNEVKNLSEANVACDISIEEIQTLAKEDQSDG